MLLVNLTFRRKQLPCMIYLTNIVIDHIDNENATSAADLKVCLVVNTITQEWGNEIGWTVGCEWKQHGCNVDDCKSNGDYEDFTNYTQECCYSMKVGDFVVTCTDSYGDGWHGAYLDINGQRYCEGFTDGDEFLSIMTQKKSDSGSFISFHNFGVMV